MSGYSSIWIKINNPELDLSLLQKQYNPDAVLTDDLLFACAIKEADEEVPTDSMEELSQQFGESIYMCVQTTVDLFIYSYWRDGLLVREIQYCGDEGWYALDGEAQETVKVFAPKSYNIVIIKQSQSQANEKETLPTNA